MDPRSFDILVNDEWTRVEEIDGNRIIGSCLKDRILETVTSYQYSHGRWKGGVPLHSSIGGFCFPSVMV